MSRYIIWDGSRYVSREEYMKYNTLFMSPRVLREYLGNLDNVTAIVPLEPRLEIYKNFLDKLATTISSTEVKDFSFLVNPQYLCIAINVGLGSYESLGRLLLLLTHKYYDKKIRDIKLTRLISEILKGGRKKLPDQSVGIKSLIYSSETFRKLLAFLLEKMLLGEFSTYYLENIENGEEHRYLAESIKDMYETPFETLKTLAHVYGENENVHLRKKLAGILYLLDSRESRGSLKASEGIEYEHILADYLKLKGIKAEIHEESGTRGGDINLGRNWDLYIPSKSTPKIVIEVMYMITTSSGQTTKISRLRNAIEVLDKNRTVKGVYILMDGIGWITRWSDANKLLNGISEWGLKNIAVKIFTFHKNSLCGFVEDLKQVLEDEGQ